MINFVSEGSVNGAGYGRGGQGSGRMPGFGDNPDDDDDLNDDDPGDGMFTPEMVCSVAKYEASLGGDADAAGSHGCAFIIDEMTAPATTTTAAPG